MTNSIDVVAQVQATMNEALNKIPDHDDGRFAVITVCLDTAKWLASMEEKSDLREFWAEKFYQAADMLAARASSQDCLKRKGWTIEDG